MNNTLNRYLNRAFVWFCVENARNILFFLKIHLLVICDAELSKRCVEVGNVTESSDTYY